MRKVFPVADPEEPVLEAAKKMVEHEYGAVLILSDDGTLSGIMTERDVLRAVAEGKDIAQIPVKDLMKKTTVVVHKDVPVRLVLQLFGAYKVRRMPVTDDDGRVIGVISSTDVVYEAIPKVLHPLAGRIGDAMKPAEEVEDSVPSAARYFASKKVDGALAGGKLISERSVIRALLDSTKPSERAERVIYVPPEMNLRNASILMKLNKIRFVMNDNNYAFTRDIAIAATERAEFTMKSYILIKTKPGFEKEIAEKASSLKSNIVSIEYVAGPYDLVLTALTGPQEEVKDLLIPLLRDKEQVVDTLTLVVLGEKYLGGSGE
ncbi:CBS domain-containing protein [Ignicoccus hospitalis]|nr:CBS domain-containing protein [Ignicoccus hospitalis]HIH90863.1 CBS domain-containing protein [Desulfurococcaceae archaeon]